VACMQGQAETEDISASEFSLHAAAFERAQKECEDKVRVMALQHVSTYRCVCIIMMIIIPPPRRRNRFFVSKQRQSQKSESSRGITSFTYIRSLFNVRKS